MDKLITLACLASLILLCGCDIPAPDQYDHAMLRECFGKSSKEVEATLGRPSAVAYADAQLPPVGATRHEIAQFNQTTEAMRYTYSTPDGDLVLQFNLQGEVYAITYGGTRVSPPAAPAAAGGTSSSP